jgi:hypothetical protein
MTMALHCGKIVFVEGARMFLFVRGMPLLMERSCPSTRLGQTIDSGTLRLRKIAMKPTNEQLANRWMLNNPQTVHINGKWYRYDENRNLVYVEKDVIKKEILSVLENARPEGIRVTSQLLNKIYLLTIKHALY